MDKRRWDGWRKSESFPNDAQRYLRYKQNMIDDACKVGLCEFYDLGNGPLGFMLGLILGGLVIALFMRWRGRKK